MTDSRPDGRYQARGVSASKDEVHAAIEGQDQGLYPGAFCKIIPDLLTSDPDHCLVMHADTAGTKSSLGYLAWREGMGVEVFAGIAQDALVMNLDDCGCVGALGPLLVSNTIGRNAKLVPGEVIAAVIGGYQAVCDLLTDQGIPCVMCGGETADVGDVVRTLDVGCTVTARLPRADVIDAARMAPGDAIVGFSSTGQAKWEDRPNSGMGSNGLTSARHEALGADYAAKYPETYAPEVDRDLVYCGSHALSDPLPGDDRFTVGSALLSPTRTYLPLIRRLVDAVPHEDLHGLIHCSGGGQTKIGKFGAGENGEGLRFVKDGLPEVPPLFRLLRASTESSWEEMYMVFNMGVRLEAIVPEDRVPACLDVATECGIDAWRTGHVEAAEAAEVVIHAEGGEHRYAI
ncbi:MAG: AIR synthase-related protein [Planctomycetota bacterium]